ncbi:OadG family protein [Reinekea sp. G2M2-21]|jgi:oxaloacetate decarboxylase gamma subunit|uniref:OadG family protein n=1 Tax=Reinekea sp. G2M2-21 TaxID=2788942 RepID=UPI0018AC50A9|nr:OadG family protein [Reinekea sp. G2M2-21]
MSELILEGVDLMFMGMGTVFVFLALLVIGTSIMSQIIMRLPAPNEIESHSSKTRRTSGEDLTEVAAVAAAVKLFHEK